MVALIQSGRFGVPFAGPFDVAWTEAYWADDPDWTNPGNGNQVASIISGGSGGRTASIGGAAAQVTFQSSVAALNNKAAIKFGGAADAVLKTATFTINPPFNLVVICVRNGTAFHGTEENIISLGDNDQGIYARSINGRWSTWTAGTPMPDGPTYTTGAGAAIRSSISAGAVTLYVNSTSASGAGDATSWTNGIGLGGSPVPTGWFPSDSSLGFAGYFSGDITADPQWANFKAWVSSYYGLTLL